MATWRPYLFFDPHDNTVLAYISKIVQDRGLVTALFSLTLSDLERSIQVTGFQWPITPNLFKITRVTIGDG